VRQPFFQEKKLSPEEFERYKKEGRCFSCGSKDHLGHDCPRKKGFNQNSQPKPNAPAQNNENNARAVSRSNLIHQRYQPLRLEEIARPSVNLIEEIMPGEKDNHLLKAAGLVGDHQAIFLFDDGSTHNFLSDQLASSLGILPSKDAPSFQAKGAFENQSFKCFLVKDVRIHIQGYVDHLDFIIGPISGADAIIGINWRRQHMTKIDYESDTISFAKGSCQISICASQPGHMIPIVNHTRISKDVKQCIGIYLLYINPIEEDKSYNVLNNSNMKRKALIDSYENIFTEDLPSSLPPKRDEDHRIDIVPGSSPPSRGPYRTSPAQHEELKKQVEDMLQRGLIRPSSSPFSSPSILVGKKDGSYRLCVDYRALNKITVKNRFPIPRIDDIFDRLRGAKIFNKIDLKSGYHQIRIVDEDIHKTAFRTPFGFYEYMVLPFGLTNAPATFSRIMEKAFRPHHGYAIVFFDGILIFSNSEEEHYTHLKAIFECLKVNSLLINRKKSEFFLEEIAYLGHIITRNGIMMDQKKIQSVIDWPTPRDVHDVKSFLGMCAYYRKFISHYSEIASPMHELTKKSVSFHWAEKQIESFIKLKQAIVSRPVLIIPDFTKPLTVIADASELGLGAVLAQGGHPIAYESRKFNKTEKEYVVYDKELLAVVHALRVWKHYLMATDFLVYTNHQSLRHFLTQKHELSCHVKWATFFQNFWFSI